MKKICNPKKEEYKQILSRPIKPSVAMESSVQEIFNEIQLKGDLALSRYTALFDGVVCQAITVSDEEIKTANASVNEDLKKAIAIAKNNIYSFHKAQKTERIEIETSPGVTCWQEKRAIQRVGLYIPGGTAPLFSTVLMLAVPAQIAGCKEIILCTPPDKTGSINPAILYAAQLCGVTQIIKAGGIQAIAAMTFGTQTVPKVYKIFGPGNQYVTAAKQYASQQGVAIDMPAGPSELLVVADDSANPAFVASDLLSQAEHGEDSQVVCITTSKKLLEEVDQEVHRQLEQLPRKTIAAKAIANSKLIYVEEESMALDIINEYAPEHLIICMNNEDYFVQGVQNAGSVFIGNYTPESAGDYASGTNHTLPTNGYAKSYSGINLDSFLKAMTFQKITQEGINTIGNTVELMAEAEGLQAHKIAVTLRLKEQKIKENEKEYI